MKRLIVIIIFLFAFFEGFSQSAYHGGRGDGYAFAEVIIPDAGVLITNANQNISIFPNPIKAKQNLFFQCDYFEKNASISIHNVIGKELFSIKLNLTLSQSVFPYLFQEKGMYFISFQTKQKVLTYKLVVD